MLKCFIDKALDELNDKKQQDFLGIFPFLLRLKMREYRGALIIIMLIFLIQAFFHMG